MAELLRVSQPIHNGNFIRLTVNKSHILAMVDSGAFKSCISLDCTQRMRLRISPLRKNDPKRLSAADGHALVCVGTIGLTLTIQGLKIPQTFPFLVVKDLNFKMILGLDFLNATRANIDFNHNTLSICDDLVIEPLLPSKKPNNILHVANNCTIHQLTLPL